MCGPSGDCKNSSKSNGISSSYVLISCTLLDLFLEFQKFLNVLTSPCHLVCLGASSIQLIFLIGGGPVRIGGPFFVPSANLTVDARLRAMFVPGFLKSSLRFSGFLGSSFRINSSKDSKENPVSDLLNSVSIVIELFRPWIMVEKFTWSVTLEGGSRE